MLDVESWKLEVGSWRLDAMFKHSLYQFVPPLKSSQICVALLWALGVLFVAVSLHVAQAASGSVASEPRTASALDSPLPTPAPGATATPTSTRASEPLVLRISPANRAKDVSRFEPLTIEFRAQVDRNLIERSFSITPDIDGKFMWDDRSLVFLPNRGWEPGVKYQVMLVRGQQWLMPPAHFSVARAIGDLSPRQGEKIAWDDEVIMQFLEPVDPASAEAAFSIRPGLRGAFRWEGASLIFSPAEEWRANTRYSVTLSPTIQTIDGESLLRSAFTLSFTTPVDKGRLSFGYGMRIQALSPDGPRAVQFESSGYLRPVTVTLHVLTPDQLFARYDLAFNRDWWDDETHIPVDDLPIVREWRQPVTPIDEKHWGDRQETLVPADVAPGLYVLAIAHPSAGSDELFLIVTRYSLVMKSSRDRLAIWANRFGEPVADMRVRAFDADHALILEGATDAQGMLISPLPIDRAPEIVVGEKDGEITVSGLSPGWEFDNWTWWWHSAPIKEYRTRAYIYTDRPIYRPGQTVHVKVAARYDNDAVYTRIPLEWDVIVRLRDARDNLLAERTLHVNEYGTLDASFELAEGGTLGTYHVEVQIKDEVHRQPFKVEEYRKPEYEVIVRAERDNLVNGTPATVTVEARTYFGAPLANARVEIATYARAYEWWWYDDDEANVQWRLISNRLTGITDADGRWVTRLTPQINDFDEYRHSVPMLIEATVGDANGQSVSAQAQTVVHDGAVDLSPSISKHYFHPNEDIPITVFARDIDGGPRAGITLTAELLGYVYGAGFTRPVVRAEGRTDENGSLVLQLKATEQDWYRVRVSGPGLQGHRVERFTWVWVYDPSHHTPWNVAEGDQALDISPDQDAYAPGDVAQVLIRTPVSGRALLTIERGMLRRAQVIDLVAPATVVPVPIQDDDAPNVYVTVNVYRRDIPNPNERWRSIPDAELLIARAKLSVPANPQRLSVSVAPDRSTYGPRDTATFAIQATDAQGKPAQAEVSFALVDESIYALAKDQTLDPFDAFYAERGSNVRTFDTFRPTRWLPCECGGGGGGGDGDLLANPRWNFPDTAYWNAAIVTDAEGRATVSVPLPDSLTRWRAVVRAITADEAPRVGQGGASITTTQPLVLRPALPRQLVQGDTVLLSAIVHNNTDATQSASVWIEIGTRMNADVADEITKTVAIAPNQSAAVGWPVTASELGVMTVTVKAESNGWADAIRARLPVVPLAVPEVASIVGDTISQAEHIIALPDKAIVEDSSVQIDLSPSIAASVVDGLAYLTGYPYGCVEQTMSKALPNAVVGRALAALGVENEALQAELPKKIDASVQRLYGFQHDDGGWGWWFDDASDEYQTAYVLFGLAMTEQAGYDVDDGVIGRGAQYLVDRLPTIADRRTQAYALFALALARQGRLSHTQALADKHGAELDTFSQAGLALALNELGDAARANAMLDRLAGRAIVLNGLAHWDTGISDGYYRQKTMASSTRSTALALDAFVRIRPADALVPSIVRWLMGRRVNTGWPPLTLGGWGTTQETAYAVVALTDFLQSSRELNAAAAYRVFINDAILGEGALGAGQLLKSIGVSAAQLRAGDNRIRIESDGGARLYYKVTQHWSIAGEASRAAGPIAVTREYFDWKTKRPLTSIQVGDVVSVRVTVSLTQESWYVAIEDPLPGGLEGLNERLNTTSYVARTGSEESDRSLFYDRYGYNNKEIHDDRVVFFVTRLKAGKHIFSYLARATQAGSFAALPARAYLMYEPEQWGRSASGAVRIEPRNLHFRALR
jgi:uncharacterized protein YfaS (alpha-2-macroglobulin family)